MNLVPARPHPRSPLPRAGAAAFLIAAVALIGQAWPAAAQTAGAVSSEFREPVTLATRDGVLEVRLTARQGRVALDTASKPVENFLLFDYALIRGAASNGATDGKGLFPAPTLQVFPGERLIVHLDNALSGLTIADYYSPQYTAKDATVPLYPIQLMASPLNLHVHGVHVSPKGNSDNVMLHIPAGMSNTYTYDVPRDMPQGAYWYHSHLHSLTSAQAYMGLAGLLAIGRTDGNLPAVTRDRIPIRNMLLQYNFVFDRGGAAPQLNNANWPQYVSTIVPPRGDELANGTYRPLLAPVNFVASPPGSTFLTGWYAGPLSIRNDRGLLQAIPSNLQRFTAGDGRTARDVPANPALPDRERDVQFTVNGQFQPLIRSKAGQTEIWVLANVSDFAYMNVQLTETATGRHPPIAIVGQDGNPAEAVHYPPTENGTRLLIPPASRFAIAVTMPREGDLVLEMPPRGGGAKTITQPGILYTSNGTANPPAVLGSLSVQPSAVSYVDGFFAFPTQTLATATPVGAGGTTTAFAEGQKLGAYTSFVDLAEATPDVTRKIVISGGFLNDKAAASDPKAFVYAFDAAAFPNMPLIQPRLGSVEEWRFVNHNNDEHPIHVHVNDFQVITYFDPTTGLRTGPDRFGVDNANAPAPTMQIDESVIEPGLLTIRTRFDTYDGLFVMHCHRLNHEDNGLMALINVIPAISSYAVVVPGAPGRSTQVRVLDGADNRLIATLTPFPGHEGDVSVAMGDVDGNGVLDLVVGSGPGLAPEVIAYSGVTGPGKTAFAKELARFPVFEPAARGGISVAATQVDGTTADNILVGSGPGAESLVRVYGTTLPAPGTAPTVFASFSPYPGTASGVSLATGFVDFSTGRNSIVTAPGPGVQTEVKVFAFPLLRPIAGSAAAGHAATHAAGIDTPDVTARFLPFGPAYKDGASLATGWLAGTLGGAKRIVVGQRAGDGTVKVFSSGSALDGGPSMYLHGPNEHGHGARFREIASFRPFGSAGGVHVATTSTTLGAHLLVGGAGGPGTGARVLKFDFTRSGTEAGRLEAQPLGEAVSLVGAPATVLAGD
ncbi:multicopper oxidase family protein [Methylobacterium planeticum]|uniref:Multicopper oxidase domain-containing protein n=1 Tax=Methylobacterium planeticum TaxID=2615211 RepID=A0A6N6MP94_9HYPH|nr:multicopper oxidase domain-containing protein [Methylobacterium planeticum]KAB1072046.1 multicopper oxidase domain-containing protein [Methylobacterium planeticum]